jgi:ABC-type multidrug transport system fused ATPase/permease subunit
MDQPNPTVRNLSLQNMFLTISRFRRVLGPRGTRWLLTCFLSSLALSLIEYALVAFLQIFLVSLGYFNRAQVPAILLPLVSLSTVGLCGLLILIGALRSTALFTSSYGSDITQEVVNSRFKQVTMYEMLMRKGRHFLPASDVHYRLSELYPKSQSFLQSALGMLVAMIQSSFLVLGMLYLAWKETLLGLAGFSVAGVLVTLANQKLAENARLVPMIQADFIKGIERVSRNWLFIRISRTQNTETIGLFDKVFRYFDVSRRVSSFNNLILVMPPFFGVCLLAVIIYVSRSIFMTKASILISILYLFLRLVQYIGNASQFLGGVTKLWPQFSEAVELFSKMGKEELDGALSYDSGNYQHLLNPETSSSKTPGIGASRDRAPGLHIQNVSFAWEMGQPRALDRVTWRVEGGEIAGIVGPSGAGKSTLLLLILGMLDPSEGKIDIDGVSPSDYFGRSSENLGYVGAEPFLMDGTLEKNLEYGLDRKPTREEIWGALEQAQLTETVRKLDRGLEHRLDENGTGLSTGQKQRLALARALLRKPKILLLDEATANLDATTEIEITNTIKRLAGKTTVLIVSHRAGILTAANKILELVPPPNKA